MLLQRRGCLLPTTVAIAAFLCCEIGHAQSLAWLAAPANVPSRITAAPVDAVRTVLKGNVHPLARAQYDAGIVDDSLPMAHMILLLQRSPEQEQMLAAVMDGLHNRKSPLYHHWLTPRQFGQHFGPSAEDISVVTLWLQHHGFKIDQVTAGRTAIIFSGTAGQVRNSFHTEIHNLNVKGERHIANLTEPEIPSALAPMVRGFLSLHNFFPKPARQDAGLVRLNDKGHLEKAPVASKSFTDVTFTNTGGTLSYFVGPQDFYTIYNELGILGSVTGSGATIAVLEESDVCNGQSSAPCNGNDDTGAFLSQFGVTTSGTLNYMFGISGYCSDPGIATSSEESEADIDTQWASAVAPGANVDFVSCASTSTTPGFMLAAEYVINNLSSSVSAMSLTYTQCEAEAGPVTTAAYSDLWEQAAAQGQTAVVSAGNGGSMLCDAGQAYATNNLSVNALGSSVYNVSAGGTDFSDTYQGVNATYWNQTVPPTSPYGTALSYIPEMAWGGVCSSPVLASYLQNMGTTTWGTNYDPEAICNYSYSNRGGDIVTVSGGGGGVSDFNSIPSWQAVYGVGLNGNNSSTTFRNLPDISFFASNNSSWGHSLLYCQSDTGATCDYSNSANDIALAAGGTSFVATQIVGMMALIVQNEGSFQGNANYTLYNLATVEYGTPLNPNTSNLAACTGSGLGTGIGTCIFQDIAGDTPNPAGGVITSDTVEPCLWSAAYTNCYEATAGDALGLSSVSDTAFSDAYPVSQGYDLATGLGSVNISGLVFGWNTVSPPFATAISVSANPAILYTTSNTGTTLTVTVLATGRGGIVAPSGTVSFSAQAFSNVCTLSSFGPFPLSPSCSGTSPNVVCVGTTSLAVPGNCFNPGTTVVPASYSGDAANDAPSLSASGASVTLIQPQLQLIPSVPQITIAGGQQGMVQLALSSSGPATGVSVICEGLPISATCSFSPTLIASLNPNQPANVTMTVSVPSSIARNESGHPGGNGGRKRWFAGISFAGSCFSVALLLLPAGVSKRKKLRRGAILLMFGLVLALATTFTGCSGSNNAMAPQASYTVFVTALASNTTSDTVTVQVTVTP
jgi:Pro-kumamolisin, activation domain